MNTTLRSARHAGENHTLTLDREVDIMESESDEFYSAEAQKLYDFLMNIPSGTLDRCVARLRKEKLINE